MASKIGESDSCQSVAFEETDCAGAVKLLSREHERLLSKLTEGLSDMQARRLRSFFRTMVMEYRNILEISYVCGYRNGFTDGKEGKET